MDNFFLKYPYPKIFMRFSEKGYFETTEGYERFESIAKKLCEQFKFLYENYSSNLTPLNDRDIHACQFLNIAKQRGAKNLDGSPIMLPESGEDPFSESSHCHMQISFLTGQPFFYLSL